MMKNAIEPIPGSRNISEVGKYERFIEFKPLYVLDENGKPIPTGNMEQIDGLVRFHCNEFFKVELTREDRISALRNLLRNLRSHIDAEIEEELKEIKMKLSKKYEEKYNVQKIRDRIKDIRLRISEESQSSS